jgi:hypothetical protein
MVRRTFQAGSFRASVSIAVFAFGRSSWSTASSAYSAFARNCTPGSLKPLPASLRAIDRRPRRLDAARPEQRFAPQHDARRILDEIPAGHPSLCEDGGCGPRNGSGGRARYVGAARDLGGIFGGHGPSRESGGHDRQTLTIEQVHLNDYETEEDANTNIKTFIDNPFTIQRSSLITELLFTCRVLKIIVIHKKQVKLLVQSCGGSTGMQAQLITYQLTDISQAEYLKQMVEPDAPILANVKGLISKVWLADEDKNTFGGFYLWENKTAMEDFMHSELVKAVVSRPFVKNVSSVDWKVNQAASLITRGLK